MARGRIRFHESLGSGRGVHFSDPSEFTPVSFQLATTQSAATAVEPGPGGLVAAIGHTPMIRLRGPSEATGAAILGKAEFLNPGGSVKDRAALFMIRAAERRGELRPGGLIVEGTAGNTGVGLTLVGHALGYRTLIVMPETQTQEKKDLLRLCGARLEEVPAVPYHDPRNYVHVAERLAEDLAELEPQGVFFANQWDNPANREAHRQTTGPEIWSQTSGRIDGFVCSVGTGGTLAGVGGHLRERRREVVVALADPMGSAMYHHFVDGELRSEGSSITEGIGQGRVTRNVAAAHVDRAYQISDDEILEVLFRLLSEEGLCLGGSSGVNVAGAIRLARDLGPGRTVVTVLPDGGQRYQSKLFNPAFLRAKNLPVPPWLDGQS